MKSARRIQSLALEGAEYRNWYAYARMSEDDWQEHEDRVAEEAAERPDRPCDPDCARRAHPAAACDCSRRLEPARRPGPCVFPYPHGCRHSRLDTCSSPGRRMGRNPTPARSPRPLPRHPLRTGTLPMTTAINRDALDRLAAWLNTYATGPDTDIDATLAAIDTLIGGFGVEHINVGQSHTFGYSASYVNLGDTYTDTILYDHDAETYYATSWGAWTEDAERNYAVDTDLELCPYCGKWAEVDHDRDTDKLTYQCCGYTT